MEPGWEWWWGFENWTNLADLEGCEGRGGDGCIILRLREVFNFDYSTFKTLIILVQCGEVRGRESEDDHLLLHVAELTHQSCITLAVAVKFYSTRGIVKLLPEAQRTQAIESETWIISAAKINTNFRYSTFNLPLLLGDHPSHLVHLPVIQLVHHHLNDTDHLPNGPTTYTYCRPPPWSLTPPPTFHATPAPPCRSPAQSNRSVRSV